MTNKQIAEIIRRGQEDELNSLANELDPQLPELGTVLVRDDGQLGFMAPTGVYFYKDRIKWEEFGPQWKPARILDDDEVAVKIPPVSEWPDNAGQVLAMYATVTSARVAPLRQIITRDEAERMERER